jgi:Cytochrome P460
MVKILIGTAVSALFVLSVGSLFVGHSQTLPAPTVDNVRFPAGYRATYTLLYTFDNYQNRQIRAVYGNHIAATVKPAEVFNFPYGSIILFESYTVKQDAAGEPLRDKNGRFVADALTTIFVMRKERGFGVDYKELRTGEWEYVAYRPDGSYATPPQASGSCALCHLTGGGLTLTPQLRNVGAQWDYVFRPDLYFSGGSGAVPDGVLDHYVFVPSTIHARPGQTVTIYNSDQILHRIVADNGSFDTGVMAPGSSFTVTAGVTGSAIPYHCAIHPRVKGQVVADLPAERGRLP